MTYVELFITPDDFEEATPTGLGLMLQRVYQEADGKPIVLRVTDEVSPKPWACSDPNNFNRLDIRRTKEL